MSRASEALKWRCQWTACGYAASTLIRRGESATTPWLMLCGEHARTFRNSRLDQAPPLRERERVIFDV
jgi:hypothetical protein